VGINRGTVQNYRLGSDVIVRFNYTQASNMGGHVGLNEGTVNNLGNVKPANNNTAFPTYSGNNVLANDQSALLFFIFVARQTGAALNDNVLTDEVGNQNNFRSAGLRGDVAIGGIVGRNIGNLLNSFTYSKMYVNQRAARDPLHHVGIGGIVGWIDNGRIYSNYSDGGVISVFNLYFADGEGQNWGFRETNELSIGGIAGVSRRVDGAAVGLMYCFVRGNARIRLRQFAVGIITHTWREWFTNYYNSYEAAVNTRIGVVASKLAYLSGQSFLNHAWTALDTDTIDNSRQNPNFTQGGTTNPSIGFRNLRGNTQTSRWPEITDGTTFNFAGAPPQALIGNNNVFAANGNLRLIYLQSDPFEGVVTRLDISRTVGPTTLV
jgi:hypothetical protein